MRFHHLAECPEAHALAVGERAAPPPVGKCLAALDRTEEFPDEAAFADPGNADECHEPGLALLLHAFEVEAERVELALATDERRAAVLADVDAEARARLHGLPHGTGLLCLAITASASRYSITSRVARWVCLPTRISSTGAAACSRTPH